jgi:hypothetical protein
MTLNQAIRDQYGIKLAPIRTEFKVHKFVIDRLRIGFAVPVEKGGLFGCVMDGLAWSVSPEGIKPVAIEVKDNEAIRLERLIWEMGRAALERGEELSEQDNERLSLAVKRLEEWL